MTDTRKPLYGSVETFEHLAVCRLIVAARELRKCVHQEGKYGNKNIVTHARKLDSLADDLWEVLNVIPGSGSIRNDGTYD